MMAQPRAAVVGTGFGCRVHVPALRAAGFDVVALVGTDAARTERRAARVGVPTAVTRLDAVLDAVDAVTIATPPETHKLLALAALRAGKHVICEKPFTLGSTEARDLVAAAERAAVTALIGHEFRWAPDRAVVARAIAEGHIGEPLVATLVQYVSLVADPDVRMPGWWFDQRAGGGWLGASGSHVVDQLRVWLGEFSTVSAAMRLVSDRRATAEDSFTVRARMTNGCDVVMQQTAAAYGPMAGMTRVAGRDGTLWVEAGEVWLADRDSARVLEVPADLVLPSPPPVSDDPVHAYTHLELGPYTRLCEVLRCGVEGSPLPTAVPIPTFADGLAEMQVLDAIRASAAADGARVNI
ncbi:MAG: Gfo/Idh/MocA family oxidoreductase [Acidimicrobiia bacterium]|nr:Gfo/Idh/MocA family oxidoreductase [Acidimicrobiia bacterium]